MDAELMLHFKRPNLENSLFKVLPFSVKEKRRGSVSNLI